MTVHLISNIPSAKFLADLEAFYQYAKAHGSGFVGALETIDGCRELFTGGIIDCDANAGYLARCLASMANESNGVWPEGAG